MTDTKPTLVLHRTGGGDPLLFSVHPDDVTELTKQLHHHLDHGSVRSVRTAEDTKVQINFGHVAAAYIEDQRRTGAFGLR